MEKRINWLLALLMALVLVVPACGGNSAEVQTADIESPVAAEPADTNAALLEQPTPFLLDVRQPEELEANGHN